MTGPRVLVIGYGNPARGDDGLGPALAERIERLALPEVSVDADYQLSVDHAALAAEHDVVVFADATTQGDAPFTFTPVTATTDRSFSTHAATPGQVMGLAATCFGATPRAYVLGIRARRLGDFDETLSAEARAGLEAAVTHVTGFIEALRGESDDARR
ncbi:MAG: hydrogenase maturation protease [Acidobacteria bacterium]|nr:hydrogenase maturation protease [Acidobacteriota bacterium]